MEISYRIYFYKINKSIGIIATIRRAGRYYVSSCIFLAINTQFINRFLFNLWYLWVRKLCPDVSEKDPNSTKKGPTSHFV